MADFYRSANLAQLRQRAHELAQRVEQQFLPLSAQQISWKPSANDWSIGQCFEHTSKTMRLFFPIFEQLQAGTYKLGWHRFTEFSSPAWASVVLASMDPPFNKLTVPAVPQSWPTHSEHDSQVLHDFVTTQDQYVAYFPVSLHDISNKRLFSVTSTWPRWVGKNVGNPKHGVARRHRAPIVYLAWSWFET